MYSENKERKNYVEKMTALQKLLKEDFMNLHVTKDWLDCNFDSTLNEGRRYFCSK